MTDTSILNDVKHVLGFTPDYDAFDSDLIIHINSAFFTLYQLGVGPKDVYTIEDEKSKWSDYTSDKAMLMTLPLYMGLKVRQDFDPPSTSFTQESLQKQIAQLEWRLYIQAEGSFEDD